MIQFIIFLVVVGLISYGIGKLLNKNKSDEATLASGCGVLIAVVTVTVLGVYFYGSYQKSNPKITTERIKNDMVHGYYYSGISTISQIKKIEIVDKIKNDDILEVQILTTMESDKFPNPNQKVAMKYKFDRFNNLFLGGDWKLEGMISIKE